MSTTKAILSAVWKARQARRNRVEPSPVAQAVTRELYRRSLADAVRLEFYRQPDAGLKWVTIGAHDHEGGTPVQIDGQGQIVKGPPALKGKPADDPSNKSAQDGNNSGQSGNNSASKTDNRPLGEQPNKPAQGEIHEFTESVYFDETAANKSLSSTGKASHGGATVEIVDNPEGKQWGYAARITKADGTVEHVSNQGQGKGTSWREAQSSALGALRSATSKPPAQPGDQKAPATGGKPAETPENKPDSAGDRDDPDAFTLERPKNATHQPKEQQGELFETKGKSDVPRGVTELPDGRRLGAAQLRVSDLKADPKRFQYKISGIDPTTGVTKELKEVKAFNPLFAGQLLVWHDPKENQSYVVNGHHRYDLARRANYGGTLNVFYIDEPSAEGARAMGALANIAEGRGTAVDAAKFMRDSGKTVGDLQASGISLQGKVASDGAVLSKMSDKIFQDLTNGLTTESRALAIGRHVSKPEVQEQLYRRLKKQESGPRAKEIPDGQVEEIAREYELAGTTTDKQTGGLFGDLESEESLVFQRAELKSFLRKEFAAERNTFKGISTKGRVARISEEAGNVLNVEANRDRAQAADQALWAFNQLANRKGDIADAIQEAAEAYYHEPRKRKTIFAELRRSIIERIDLDTGGLRSDDAKRGGNAEDGSIGAGDGSPGPSEGTKEQFAREFARRDLVERFSRAFAERYAAGPVAVVESTRKRSQVAANYRPAFGAARCGTCEFYRAGACSQVAGEVRAEDVCDLFIYARAEHWLK